jgi:hypothetical protein
MEPWNIKADDAREADFLPTFIIFCEDEVSEPVYFKYFETLKIKVNLIGGQKSKLEHVAKAITRCMSDDLMEIEGGVYRLKAEETHIWCVFDRDVEPQQQLQNLGNTSFDLAINTARASGIKVAWSNDAFELWVLLHFEDIDPTDQSSRNRAAYYDRLTAIFGTLPNPNADLVKVLLRPDFQYKESLKHENNFRSIVRAEIIGKTNDAVARARQLEAFHAVSGVPTHRKAPCTMVHHLVEELLKFGGKDLK